MTTPNEAVRVATIGRRVSEPPVARTQLSAAALAAARGIDVERYKTQLCKTFRDTGSCPYKKRCMFAHGSAQLRSSESNADLKSVVSALTRAARADSRPPNPECATTSPDSRSEQKSESVSPVVRGTPGRVSGWCAGSRGGRMRSRFVHNPYAAASASELQRSIAGATRP
eukprot:CAMPEP_0174835636 /NCGR_PEP_ID=MMETSP1114-20130205/5509_1 /TAXON_ID=312471 /ORGANISM="Neobodo designis, Strain CCAP 1951/1" /LENGTH=169 /DNA_ID=CAMNT_0016069589 /DNA_START=69 /DNA_END=578 /DNA_ORIENTATION=+